MRHDDDLRSQMSPELQRLFDEANGLAAGRKQSGGGRRRTKVSEDPGDPEQGKESRSTVPFRPREQPQVEEGEDGPHLTDEGNAQRMIRRHGDILRHCQPWRKWIVWDGKQWRVDDTLATTRCAKDVPGELYQWAQKEIDEIANHGGCSSA